VSLVRRRPRRCRMSAEAPDRRGPSDRRNPGEQSTDEQGQCARAAPTIDFTMAQMEPFAKTAAERLPVRALRVPVLERKIPC
jgi:hypothetical protein